MDEKVSQLTFEPGGETAVDESIDNGNHDPVHEVKVNDPDSSSWDSETLLLDGDAGQYSIVGVREIEPSRQRLEVEEVSFTPLHVMAGTWELGSLTSIRTAHRSRTNTVTRYEELPVDGTLSRNQRILTRVVKNAIGSGEFANGKNGKLDSEARFITKATGDEYEESTVCCERNLKNILVISTGIILLYIALGSLRNLQSSMNNEGGVGVYSLAATFGGFMMGSIISPVLVKWFAVKRCLVISCALNVIYVLANFSPTFVSLIPASLLQGLCNAILWTSISVYITEIGFMEAESKGKKTDHVISKFFGIFFLTYQLAPVIGNLMSSLILVQTEIPSGRDTIIYHTANNGSTDGKSFAYVFQNFSEDPDKTIYYSYPDFSVCGATYCYGQKPNTTSTDTQDLNRTFLLGTYGSCIIIGSLVMQFFLDQLTSDVEYRASVKEVLTQCRSVIGMLCDVKFLLVLPVCIYSVLENGFVVADVTMAYVTCPLGISMVGYTMICYGLCGAATSYISGKLVKYVDRLALFVIASATNVASLAWMSVWSPTQDNVYLHFILLGVWGLSDGIWQSQTNSVISAVFPEKFENAFGCCRFMQGLTGIGLFTLSNHFCVGTKIPFILGSCLVALACYIVMEIIRRRDQKPGTVDDVKVDSQAI